jgi:hypothetical protein
MAQNIAPIFPLVPVTSFVGGAAANAATPGVTANNTYDLTTGTSFLVFTSNATNGSRLDFIKVRPLGTNVQTVMRVFINNGSTTATAANNALFLERTMFASTASASAETQDNAISMNISLTPGYRVYVTFGTAVAAGFHLTAVGGDY